MEKLSDGSDSKKNGDETTLLTKVVEVAMPQKGGEVSGLRDEKEERDDRDKGTGPSFEDEAPLGNHERSEERQGRAQGKDGKVP